MADTNTGLDLYQLGSDLLDLLLLWTRVDRYNITGTIPRSIQPYIEAGITLEDVTDAVRSRMDDPMPPLEF